MSGEAVQEVVRHRAMITVCAIGATVLQLLDQTIANVALPLHAGQFFRELRRDHLGADLLHHRFRDRDSTSGLAGRALWPQAALCQQHPWLHDHVDALRRSPVAGTDRGVSRIAGGVRCRSGTFVASHAPRHLSAPPARLCHGDPGDGDHARADHGTDGRRLADGNLQLALGVLHQPAVRSACRRRSDDLPSRQQQAGTTALRLARIWGAGGRYRRHAVDAGPWAGSGLVWLARDHLRGGGRQPGFVPVPGSRFGGSAAADPAGAVQGCQFHVRRAAHVHGRHLHGLEPRADDAVASGIEPLPGRNRRIDHGAARVRKSVHHHADRPPRGAGGRTASGGDRTADADLYILGDDELDAGRVGARDHHHDRHPGRRDGAFVHSDPASGVRHAGACDADRRRGIVQSAAQPGFRDWCLRGNNDAGA